MKKYIYIGAGGALGAIIRFIIEHIQVSRFIGNIPWNTLVINITGSFLLSYIFITYYEVYKLNENLKLAITTGFFGAYTTFSTMCKEIDKLINTAHFYSAVFYIILSGALGICAAYLGMLTAKNVVNNLVLKEDNISDYNLEERNE